MYGLLLVELQRYLESTLGRAGWADLLAQTGPAARIYLPGQAYPDDEWDALVAAAAGRRKIGVPALLEEAGAFFAPRLLATYGAAIPSSWGPLDLIAGLEDQVYPVVRRKPAAAPPHLQVEWASARELIVVYDSPRRLCALAKGLLAGVGAHYATRLLIRETACMHFEQPACRISVKLPSPPG